MAQSRPFATGEQGFTLTELLVVLAIMALMLTAAPAILQSALPGLRTGAAARGLADDLRRARAQAMASGAPVDVHFDAAHEAYAVVAGGRTSARRTAVRFAVAGGHNDVEFFPDGSATPAVLWVGDGAARYRIQVDWLTGHVAIHE